jgi:hypothetical protein
MEKDLSYFPSEAPTKQPKGRFMSHRTPKQQVAPKIMASTYQTKRKTIMTASNGGQMSKSEAQ